MPALELYQGGCFPQIRARLGGQPALRARIRILSARHGLVSADAPLRTYDQPINGTNLVSLTALVDQQLARELAAGGVPAELLVVAEPAYLELLGELPASCRLRWIEDPRGWYAASAVLDGWGWP
nr:hypothetical protein [Actinoplanes sp. L3-i22]